MTFSPGDLFLVLPELLVITAACLVFVLDPVLSSSQKDGLAWLSLGTLAICMGLIASQMGHAASAFGGIVIIDAYACFWRLLLCFVAALTVLLSHTYLREERLYFVEYYGFVLLSLSGMMVMVSAADLLTIYLGTELMSISLYIMVGLKRSKSRSLEASAKYFVLGSFSSGILLYGISLLYGATGSMRLPAIAAAIVGRSLDDPLLLAATILLAVGFSFKLAVVPFHMWVPDVYQGAPTSVTAFMAVASKAATFGAFLRVFVEGLGGLKANWSVIFLLLCIATLVLGNIVALVQTNIKRMLAYSTISHMGFLLLGVIAGTAQGYGAAMFYVSVYVIMALGAFGMILIMSRDGFEAEELEDLKGLNQRHPWYAFIMLVMMFSMAGVPPTVGFWAKLSVLQAVMSIGYVWLAVLAVLMSLVGAFYYLRVVKLMYFDDAPQSASIEVGMDSRVLLSVNGLAVLVLGLMPGALLALCERAITLSLRIAS